MSLHLFQHLVYIVGGLNIRSSILGLPTTLGRSHIAVLFFTAATGIPILLAVLPILIGGGLWKGIRIDGVLLDLSSQSGGYRWTARYCFDGLPRIMRRRYTVNLALKRRMAELILLELLERRVKLLLLLILVTHISNYPLHGNMRQP